MAVVESVVPPLKASRGTRTSFHRSSKGLKRLLEEAWRAGIYYLGEWHLHPAPKAKASRDDLDEMQEIATNPRYRCPEPILIVAGLSPPGTLNLEVHVVPANEAAIRLSQISDHTSWAAERK